VFLQVWSIISLSLSTTKRTTGDCTRVTADKKKVVAQLRKDVKAADKIYLATDEDREGEAIAWHLLEALNLPKDTPRIVFVVEVCA
jgi:DNA topoisomerase IA